MSVPPLGSLSAKPPVSVRPVQSVMFSGALAQPLSSPAVKPASSYEADTRQVPGWRKALFLGPIAVVGAVVSLFMGRFGEYTKTLTRSMAVYSNAHQALETMLMVQPDKRTSTNVGDIGRDEPCYDIKAQMKELRVSTADKESLHAWYVPAQPGKPTILLAHGNAGNLRHTQYEFSSMARHGYGVLAFDYRGFGQSSGVPSEQGFYQDFQAASQYLESTVGVPRSQIVAAGFSMGGAVAIDAASKATDNPYKALLTFSTFSNMTAMVEKTLKSVRSIPLIGPFIANTMVKGLQQRFQSDDKIGRVTSPIRIFHGEDDSVIPYPMAAVLESKVSHGDVMRIPLAGHDHNDLFAVYPHAETVLMHEINQVLE